MTNAYDQSADWKAYEEQGGPLDADTPAVALDLNRLLRNFGADLTWLLP